MTKKEAKSLINKQKSSLNANTLISQSWLDQTHEFITRIFGTSVESLALPMYGTFYSINANKADLVKAEKELRKFFDVYLDFIDRGLYKTNENSFIEGFRNSQLRKWGLYLIVGSFILGYIFGAYDNPKSIIHNIIKNNVERAIKS